MMLTFKPFIYLFLFFAAPLLCIKSVPVPSPGNQVSHCNHVHCHDVFSRTSPANDPFSYETEDLLDAVKNKLKISNVSRSPVSTVRGFPSTLSDMDTLVYTSRAPSLVGLPAPSIFSPGQRSVNRDLLIADCEIEKTAASKLTDLIKSRLNELRLLQDVRIDPDSVRLIEEYPSALVLFDKIKEKIVFAEFKAIRKEDAKAGDSFSSRRTSMDSDRRSSIDAKRTDNGNAFHHKNLPSSSVDSWQKGKHFKIKLYYKDTGSVTIDNESYSRFFDYLDIDFNDKYAFRSQLTGYISDVIIRSNYLHVVDTVLPSTSFLY